MGYYMMYISTDTKEISLSIINDALKSIDPQYSITENSDVLMFGADVYGQLSINSVDESDEEIEEFKEDLTEATGKNKNKVLQTLNNAKYVFAVQVLFGKRDIERTLSVITPLWDWLFENRKGLLYAQGEGYYNKSGLILEIE